MPSVPEVMPPKHNNPEENRNSRFSQKINDYQANLGQDLNKPLGLEQLVKLSEKIENSVPNFDPFISVTAD